MFPSRTLYTKKLTKKGNRRVPRMLSQGRGRVYVFVMSIKRAELADRTPLTYLPLPSDVTTQLGQATLSKFTVLKTLFSIPLPGGDDKLVKFWEVCTGRCLKTLQCDGAVLSIAWNPNPSLTLLAVVV